MNYYEETLEKINKYLNENKIDDALKLIEKELEAPYLPKEFNDELVRLYKENRKIESFKLDDDNLEEYLYSTYEKQLIAVNYLDKKNLRDYIDICNKYLCSDGFINAKVLLIDSLIRQEIGEEISMINEGMEYNFIPKYLLPVEESDGYLSAKKYLQDIYLKEPSKLKMSMDLLYKELILNLPINMIAEEGIILAKKIEEYINKAFN